MGLNGYKLKFVLHAAHNNIDQIEEKKSHDHSFLIAIYFKTNEEQLELSKEYEDHINEWLTEFQNKNLNEIELFKGKNATIELIAETFFEILIKEESDYKVELLRLEVQDNLSRTYTVSKHRLDDMINEIQVVPFIYEDIHKGDGFLDIEVQEKYKDKKIEETQETQEENILTVQEGESRENTPNVEEMDHTDNIDQSLEEIASGLEQTEKVRMPRRFKKSTMVIKCVAAMVFITSVFIAILYFMKVGGHYPQGWDTLCHLYRADLLLNNIKEGNLYPLYDPMWYNGVEIMRYWAPLPLYIIAGIEGLIKSNVYDAYIVFCGLIYFFGAIGWLIHGVRFKRIGLAVFLGTAWYFFPENLRVLILDGNLPRAVINTILPFFLLSLWNYLENKKNRSIIGIIFFTALMGLCHIGFTFMAVFCVLIFTGFYAKINKCPKKFLAVTAAMLLGIGIIGVWMVPSLIGGSASRGSSGNQVMSTFFKSAFISLNPKMRFEGDMGIFYYGLSIFIVTIIGIILGTKKTLPGFLCTIIIFFCTTSSAYQLFVHLPFSSFLWMIRFVTISLAFFVLSLFLWKNLKRWFILAILSLLLIDCISSIPYIYVKPSERIQDVNAEKYRMAEDFLINEAKDITKQRMAIMELSSFGAFAPYYVAGVDKKCAYTFGAGWEGSKTANNIVSLNGALETGKYKYLFDRCIEMGTDTIVFPIHLLWQKNEDIDKVIDAGKSLGYELINQNSKALLFQLKLDPSIKNFGTVTKYENIAIGKAAKQIALLFPSFEEGGSDRLDDYTLEELKKYKKVYLSDFTYLDKIETEDKLIKLSESGTKVYIDMNRIPVNKKTNQYEILGVNEYSITFNDSFTPLQYNGQVYRPGDFGDGLSQWNTIYLAGLKNVTGYTYMSDNKLAFVGTNEYDNITFIGFNLVYHTETTSDEVTKQLLSTIFEEDEENMPKRDIVPIEINRQKNIIKLSVKSDNVNTSLSNLDIFHADREVEEKNNLLVINSGITTITLMYPYFAKGMLVTIVSTIIAIVFCALIIKHDYKKLK